MSIILWTVVLCVLPAAQAPAENAGPANTVRPDPSTIVAVIPVDAPPTYYREPKSGAASGFAVEVMDQIARNAGLSVKYVFKDNWSDMITMVRRGEADVIPGMGMSKERRQELDFTDPIDAFSVSFFVRSHSPGLAAQPSPHVVGVIKGSVAFEHLKARPDITLRLYEGFGQGLFDLLAGKIDAFACPVPTLLQLARKSGVEDRIKIVDKPITEITRALAVRRGDEVLLKRLNHAVKGFVGTPAYQDLYAKWYGKPSPYWTPGRIVALGSLLLLIIVSGMAGLHYFTTIKLNRTLQSMNAELTQAEMALTSQTEVLRSFMNAITESAFLVGTDGVVLAANDVFSDRLGRKYGDVVGSRLERILPEDVAQGRMEYIREIIRTGKPVRFEDRRLDRHIHNSVYPVFGHRGEVLSAAIIGVDITERTVIEEERERLIAELQKTLAAIKTLHGIIPICSSCKKIRDDEGSWKQLETYISEHTDAAFSHGVCTECAKKLYPGYFEKKESTGKG